MRQCNSYSSKNLQDDPFSKLLANVVKDSSILQKNEPVKEEVKRCRKRTTTIAKMILQKLIPLLRKLIPTAKTDSTKPALAKETDSTVRKLIHDCCCRNKQPSATFTANQIFK